MYVTILRSADFTWICMTGKEREIFTKNLSIKVHPSSHPKTNRQWDSYQNVIRIKRQNEKYLHIALRVLWLFWRFPPFQLCLLSLYCGSFLSTLPLICSFFIISVNGKGHFVYNRAMLSTLMSCKESRSSPLLLSAVIHMSPCAGSLSTQMEKHQIWLLSTYNNKSTNWFMDKQINFLYFTFSWMSLEVCVCWMSK